jgi:RNA polymerase sigma factor (sigma-70 family)
MESGRPDLAASDNPPLPDSPLAWDRLIEAVGPPSMLVVIARRMSSELRARLAPEDVWQETLLFAWRDRARCQWRGVSDFRRWLLSIAENRLRNLADWEGAVKRGAGARTMLLSALDGAGSSSNSSSQYAGPAASTTPSRVASDRERAEAMQKALDALAPELREVVQLRLFEDLTMEDVAQRLGIGVDAARFRFRRGSEAFCRRLAPHAPDGLPLESAERARQARPNASP